MNKKWKWIAGLVFVGILLGGNTRAVIDVDNA